MTTPAYRVDGPPGAPALVLANSLGTSWEMWAPQLPVLVARFRVVRYEHPGHGSSRPTSRTPATVADLGQGVLAVLDELGIERASVCGVSLGGMVAMWLGASHPERVDRLVLACTAPRLGPPEAWTKRAATVRAGGTGALLESLLGRWFTPGFVERHPEVAAQVEAMLAATDPGGYAACCEVIASMDQTADLGRIAAPTLVLAGALDPVAPPATALEIQSAIPGASLRVLASAAHLANIEAPEAFTGAVVDHLTGLPAERGDRVRRAVLGDAHVDRSQATTTPLTAAFTDFITRYAWGDVWTRPGLDRRTRSCITVAVLTALGRHEELALHVDGARRNGCSDEEIAEIVLHTAVYAGVPASNAAWRVVRQVLADAGSEETADPGETAGPGKRDGGG